MLPQNHDLDMTPNGVPIVVNVSQYDVGREINFYLYNGSEVYTPAVGALIRIEGTKPDNTGFSYNTTYTGNKVTISITDQMTVLEGEVRCELRVTEGGSDVGSLNFILLVEKAALRSDIPISDTEIPAIIELARAEQYNAEAWANGERNGVPVGPTDPQYHNNAKYWSENAQHGSLDMLSDVEITTPSDGQALIYDANTDEWVNGDVVDALDDLSDTNITTPADGEFLQFNGADSEWVNTHDEISAIENVYGSKNLFNSLAQPYYINSNAVVTPLDNGIRVSVSNSNWGYVRYFVAVNKNTDYIFSTNVTVTSGESTVYIRGTADYSLTTTTEYINRTNVSGNVSGTFNTQNYPLVCIELYCTRNTTTTGDISYDTIMLLDARVKDLTYVPYAPTNRDCMSYAANTKLGAHNLLRITKPTQVFNGVTFTISNETGVISMSGTVGSQYNYAMADLSVMNTTELAGKTVIVSGGSNVTNVYLNITCKNAGGTIVLDQNVNLSGEQITIPATTAKIELYIIADSTYSGNLTVYPMIRLASDTDTTYTPYAMTNRELTVNLLTALFANPVVLTSSNNLNNITTAGVYQIAGSVPTNAPTGFYNTYSALIVLSGGTSTAITQIYIGGGWRNESKHIAIRGYGGTPAAWSAWRYITDATS